MSLTKLIPSLLVATLAVGMTTTPAKAQLNPGSGIVITDLNLQDIEIVDGILTAASGTVSGTIAGLPFTTDIENFQIALPGDDAPADACSVLNLSLAPIDIDLLGLHVDTSAICLEIYAVQGEGLLGDLLCGLTGGGTLLDIGSVAALEGVLSGELEGLQGALAELSQVLNAALAGQGTPSGPVAQQEPEEICDGAFHILDLAVGPVDLNLLGLVVELDNCDNPDGPVQVCVSADQGQGLLGDLLVGLLGGGLLDGLNLGALTDLIDAILGGLGGGAGLPATANATPRELNQLNAEVGRLLRDGTLTANEADRLSRSVAKIARK